jgi:hypothetical protein
LIYIGYDPTQSEAYNVCEHSIRQLSDIPITKLYSDDIPEYKRSFPNELQSTDFTFTRFLVPFLSRKSDIEFSIFCDSDFLFLKDPIHLINLARQDPTKAVHVCKHPKYFPNSSIKMNHLPQHTADRKNWASLMVFNNYHPALDILDSNYVNTTFPGRDLHNFSWCKDDLIGSIPLEWNCLADYYHLESPHAVHFTDGLPIHDPIYRSSRYADSWLACQEDFHKFHPRVP